MELVRQYHGYKPMAIGTRATTTEAQAVLKRCALDHLMNAVAGSDQVKDPKPAPDTFLRCAQLLGVEPGQCVVFEDSPLGWQAAHRAGRTGVDVLAVHQIKNEYFL